MTLSESRPYKNTLKKGVYTAKKEGDYIHGAIYIYISCSNSGLCWKKHMNSHYFRCSDLKKLIIVIIIIIIIITIKQNITNLWRNTNRRPEYSFWVHFLQQDTLGCQLSFPSESVPISNALVFAWLRPISEDLAKRVI